MSMNGKDTHQYLNSSYICERMEGKRDIEWKDASALSCCKKQTKKHGRKYDNLLTLIKSWVPRVLLYLLFNL